ncbi:MAG: TIGR02206 family membrane protein [Planctomycetota bacterium]|nr:MAG: TIGR02206 family membrane protein [Planctomycetota bacterium]
MLRTTSSGRKAVSSPARRLAENSKVWLAPAASWAWLWSGRTDQRESAALEGEGEVDRAGDGVGHGDGDHALGGAAAGDVEGVGDRGTVVCEAAGLVADGAGDGADVLHAADGDGGQGEVVVADGDDVEVVQVAGVGGLAGLHAADGGEGDVLDAVAGVEAGAVDVAGEDGRDVAGLDESGVDLVPVGAVVAAEPAGVVQEEEDVPGVLGLVEGFVEPGELLGAHGLGVGLGDALLAGIGVALVGVEDDEGAALVLEGVPERAEVGLEVLLVLALGRVVAAPVDVVVAGDGEPGAVELVHDALELAHLGHPGLGGVVALDEVADGHDQVGLEEVGVGDGLVEDLDPVGGAAGAVAVDDEEEGVVLGGQREDLGRGAVGGEAGMVGDRLVGMVARVIVVVVALGPGVGGQGGERGGDDGGDGGGWAFHAGTVADLPDAAGQERVKVGSGRRTERGVAGGSAGHLTYAARNANLAGVRLGGGVPRVHAAAPGDADGARRADGGVVLVGAAVVAGGWGAGPLACARGSKVGVWPLACARGSTGGRGARTGSGGCGWCGSGRRSRGRRWRLVWYLLPRNFDWYESLPLHLCDLAAWVAPLALLTQLRWLRSLLYFWGIGLSTQAFFTPVVEGGYGHFSYWLFFVGHLHIVGSAVYDVVVLGYRPRLRDWGVVTLLSLAWIVPVTVFNVLMDVNYGYTGNTAPGGTTLIDYLGPWPWRIGTIVLGSQVLFAAVFVPWVVVGRRRRRYTPS